MFELNITSVTSFVVDERYFRVVFACGCKAFQLPTSLELAPADWCTEHPKENQ